MIAFQSLWSLQDFISWNQTVMDRSAGSFSLSKAKSIVSFVQLGGRAQKLPPLILTRFSFFKKSEEDEKVQKKSWKQQEDYSISAFFDPLFGSSRCFSPCSLQIPLKKKGWIKLEGAKFDEEGTVWNAENSPWSACYTVINL